MSLFLDPAKPSLPIPEEFQQSLSEMNLMVIKEISLENISQGIVRIYREQEQYYRVSLKLVVDLREKFSADTCSEVEKTIALGSLIHELLSRPDQFQLQASVHKTSATEENLRAIFEPRMKEAGMILKDILECSPRKGKNFYVAIGHRHHSYCPDSPGKFVL